MDVVAGCVLIYHILPSSYRLPEYPPIRRAVSMPELLTSSFNPSVADDIAKTKGVNDNDQTEENSKGLNDEKGDGEFVEKNHALMSDDLEKVETDDKDVKDHNETSEHGTEEHPFQEKGEKEDNEETPNDIPQHDVEDKDEENDKDAENNLNAAEVENIENDPTTTTLPQTTKTEKDHAPDTLSSYQPTSKTMETTPTRKTALPPIVSMDDYKSKSINKEMVRPKLGSLKSHRKKQNSIKRTDSNPNNKGNDPKITIVEV